MNIQCTTDNRGLLPFRVDNSLAGSSMVLKNQRKSCCNVNSKNAVETYACVLKIILYYLIIILLCGSVLSNTVHVSFRSLARTLTSVIRIISLPLTMQRRRRQLSPSDGAVKASRGSVVRCARAKRNAYIIIYNRYNIIIS